MKFHYIAFSVFAALFNCGVCFAQPPKIIKMAPKNGAVDVRPGNQKIRILFDQDMDIRSMAICGSGDNFPEIIGKPRWTSERAFLMNVKLEPNHEYEFGVNCPSAQNFKSVRGEPAEILFVKFCTAGLDGKKSTASSSKVKEQNQQAVEILQNVINNNYSYKEMKNIDWNKLFDRYSHSLLNASSSTDFAKNAGLLLAHAKDKHIWLIADHQRVSCYENPVTANINIQLLPQLIPNFKKHNNEIYSGSFPGGIGYLFIGSWSRKKEKEIQQAISVLYKFSNTSGLIIDIRGNGGGDESIARRVAGCFVDEPQLYAKNINVDPKRPGHFTQVYDRYVHPDPKGPQYRNKVAVLIGPAVMSSGEGFTLMMKQVPNCTIIGESTQGSSGRPMPHDLGNGVTVYLPSWKAMLPDGTCFEGKGIRPDILVKVRPDQITTKDPVIEAALKELKKP